MPEADPEGRTLWYYFAALGLLCALMLHPFVPAYYSVWFLVPLIVWLGNAWFQRSMKRVAREIEADIEASTKVLKITELEGFGKLYQYPMRLELVLQPHRKILDTELDIIDIDSTDGIPTEAQLNIVRSLDVKLSDCMPAILGALTKHVRENGWDEELDPNDLKDFSISILAPGEGADLSVDFSSEAWGDMGHTVYIKNWKVQGIISGD